jgi:hypothetical protein
MCLPGVRLPSQLNRPLDSGKTLLDIMLVELLFAVNSMQCQLAKCYAVVNPILNPVLGPDP